MEGARGTVGDHDGPELHHDERCHDHGEPRTHRPTSFDPNAPTTTEGGITLG